MIATKQLTRPAALAGRLEGARLLPWLGLGFVLAVSAVLNLWNLAQNGYGNTYYAVAVRSMLASWKNFFFAAYDAGGFITVDKPPVALWIQALSAKIVGFSGLALLVPEALAGVASVALLYFLVKRLFGSLAGFLAAMTLALTPIAVAVDRSNNTDSWLMFTLLLAAWAITLATEKGQFRLLALSMALVGVAFNIKMLAAWIILPAFFVLYLLAAPLNWKKRLLHLTLAGAIALTVSLSWAVAVDLTPANQRPYIGGSQTNSVLELALGYNGLGRITGQGETMGGGPNAADRGSFTPPTNLPGSTGTSGSTTPGDFTRPDGGFGAGTPPTGQPGGNGGSFNTGTPGVFRLVNSELAAQWSWLLPLAGLGLAAAAFGVRRKLPLEPKGQALLLWGGWLLTYGAVFSMASGIFHNYYLIMLAPAAAALAGAGVAALWAAYRRGGWRAGLLPLALLITAAWQVKVLADFPDWSAWLAPLVIGGSVLAALVLVAARLLTRQAWRRVAPALLAVGLLALALASTTWASTAVLAAGNGTIPTVGPSQLSGRGGFGAGWPGGETANGSLVSYLEANQGDTFYLVAVSSANQASSIALATGQPVLAMGGFTGSDPAMTVEKLQELVATNQVRYVMIGGGGPGGASADLTSWVQANGTAVDSSLYGGTTTGGLSGAPGGMGNGTLYDLAAP